MPSAWLYNGSFTKLQRYVHNPTEADCYYLIIGYLKHTACDPNIFVRGNARLSHFTAINSNYFLGLPGF
jgi:hypothetical protein